MNDKIDLTLNKFFLGEKDGRQLFEDARRYQNDNDVNINALTREKRIGRFGIPDLTNVPEIHPLEEEENYYLFDGQNGSICECCGRTLAVLNRRWCLCDKCDKEMERDVFEMLPLLLL